MSLREYETLYILRPELSNEEIGALNERFSSILDREGGTVLRQEIWGKRKLAYEIAKQPKGVFVSLSYLAQPGAVKELERNFKINDAALKYQTIRIGEVLDKEKRVAEVEAEERTRAAERAARQAAFEASQEARVEEVGTETSSNNDASSDDVVTAEED